MIHLLKSLEPGAKQMGQGAPHTYWRGRSNCFEQGHKTIMTKELPAIFFSLTFEDFMRNIS